MNLMITVGLLPIKRLSKPLIKTSSRRFMFTSLIIKPVTTTNLKFQLQSLRFNSSTSSNNTPSTQQKVQITPEVYEKQQIIKDRIPGQKPQSNTLSDRFPSSLKLEKEAIPTLLPSPTSPPPSTLPLSQMYQILSSKTEPELIYESEPHKLYFLFCSCLALVFIIYAINAGSIGFGLAYGIYNDNEMNLKDWQNDLQLAMHTTIVALCATAPFLVGVGFALLPSRLIRRMWYLPSANKNKEAFVRFTTHPILPYRPTPVHIMPISQLQKNKRAKVYTGDGFYGTLDSFFMFFLKEQGRKFPWVVDRKGFFWGDGRAFDLLFSKDSIDTVENAKSIDEQYGDILKLKRLEENKLRKELGVMWKAKSRGKLMIEDLNKLKRLISSDSNPAIENKKTSSKEVTKSK